MVILFTFQFFLEGMHRTPLFPMLIFAGALGAVSLIPIASKLPFTFQRVLAIVPEGILQIDAKARMDAEGSSQWRIDLWESILPQVPTHLLLGKGYTITREDYQMMGYNTSFKAVDASQQGHALAYDYHNGPLSVIIPFGIWGAFGFCWFVAIAIWALIRNYRFGDPALKVINSFLLAAFLQKTLMFFSIFGALNSDMAGFAGLLGLSIAMNKGVRQARAVSELEAEPLTSMPRLLQSRPSFQR
jgi:hypothetical protein